MVGARHLTVIAALALAAPAAQLNAQQPWGQPGYAYGSYSPRYSQVAQDEGYRRGLLAGQEDRRRGAPFNFTGESDYRRADIGYRSEYGNRDQYREEFRSAFAVGYREGFGYVDSGQRYGSTGPPPWSNGRGRGAYGRNNNQYGRYDPAFNNGYSDGYEEGLNDGRKHHRNDPLAESRYRNGDHGYERNYGTAETYKMNYRQGFTDGYQRGFSDGSRY
jgi:hypothetical protein